MLETEQGTPAPELNTSMEGVGRSRQASAERPHNLWTKGKPLPEDGEEKMTDEQEQYLHLGEAPVTRAGAQEFVLPRVK